MKIIRVFAAIFTFIEFLLLYGMLVITALYFGGGTEVSGAMVNVAWIVLIAVGIGSSYGSSRKLYRWLANKSLRTHLVVLMAMMLLSIITMSFFKVMTFMVS